MKISRHELRKLIEGIFIGDDDGTILSPKDVDDFEYSGQVKDDEALGRHPKLDQLLKSTDLPTKKQGRQIAVSLDYQDNLTPYEELAVDHIDPAHIHGPPPIKKTNMLQNPKVHRMQAEITKEFKQYLTSPEGTRHANTVFADFIEAFGRIPRGINWRYGMIDNESGFNLKARIYNKLGYDVDDGYLTNTEHRNIYNTLMRHLIEKLNHVAKERFDEDFIKVAVEKIKGESFPLALTETEIKQMVMEELEERKKRKKKKKKKKSKKRNYLYPYVFGYHYDHDHDIGDYGDGGGDGGGGE